MSARKAGRLLLVTHVRLRPGPSGLAIDDQTAAGLVRWAEHFEAVTFAGIRLDAEKEDSTSVRWVDIAALPCADRLRVLDLPMAYRIGAFARTYGPTRRLLAREIRAADHLCFTLGYLTGDWGAVAAIEAKAQKRRHAVWFDRVEHEVLRRALPSMPAKRRLKEQATLLVMAPFHHRLVRAADLGLFQGRETFDAFAPHASNPALVYDVHTSAEDMASADAIAAKAAEIGAGAPLRILYAGRVAEMKGPLDWLEALAGAARRGVSFHAEWMGDGPMLDAMIARAAALGIADRVHFAGHVADRARLLAALREAHLFLFCHKTPESPRCLVEALVSACPIVGYDGAYPAGLLDDAGGGRLSPRDDAEALGATLHALDRDRPALAAMVAAAGTRGRHFDEETLYAERAALIARFA